MKIMGKIGFLCELSEAEVAMLREIAERDGLTLEEALQKAVKKFLSIGVQTPNRDKPLEVA